MGKHSAAILAKYRADVLGLCDHCTAHAPYHRQRDRRLVDSWPDALWHLAAVAIVIVERVATFSYFIPTMAALMGSDWLAEEELKAALSRWLFLNHGRHVLTLAGWLAALKATGQLDAETLKSLGVEGLEKGGTTPRGTIPGETQGGLPRGGGNERGGGQRQKAPNGERRSAVYDPGRLRDQIWPL